MADTPTDPAPTDGPDYEKAFSELLEKIGLPWLEKHRPPSSPSSPGSSGVEAFLQSAMAKLEKTNEKLSDQLEAMRDLLTQEQLTLLKSRKSGDVADPSKPTKKEQLEPPQDKPQEKPKPRSKWL